MSIPPDEVIEEFIPTLKSRAATHEPPPVPNASRPVWDVVLDDIRARDAEGRRKYGTPLQCGNGRDALWDLYQELLDAVVYCRQAILERDAKP